MVTVAVAGGTGGVGRTVVEELVRQGKHKVIILSRKNTTIPELSVSGYETKYDDPAALKKLLEDHNVEVIISAIVLASEDTAKSQLNLIKAASEIPTIKRFIPSEYGINYTPEAVQFHPSAKWWVDAADALRASHIDFTRVVNGWLSDYNGLPHVKSNMKPFRYVLDFENHRAVIPGSGDEPVSMIHSSDLARYVVALLDEEKKWPEISPFASDVTSWNQMVRLAEKVTGTNWDIQYESVEKLEKHEATVFEQPKGMTSEWSGDALRELVSEFGLMATRRVLDVSELGLRNDEFPAIKPLKVAELVEKAWGKRSSA